MVSDSLPRRESEIFYTIGICTIILTVNACLVEKTDRTTQSSHESRTDSHGEERFHIFLGIEHTAFSCTPISVINSEGGIFHVSHNLFKVLADYSVKLCGFGELVEGLNHFRIGQTGEEVNGSVKRNLVTGQAKETRSNLVSCCVVELLCAVAYSLAETFCH